MTTDEHKLLITMFSKQYQQLQVIIDILKSRRVLEGDDPLAFATAVHSDSDRTKFLLWQTSQIYLDTAKALGIETGITPPPKAPNP